MTRFHHFQSMKKDADGDFPPLVITPFTAQEEADADASVPTPADKDARAIKEAAQRVKDPAILVLARAAGLTDAQFEIDLAAEIRLGL